MQNSKYGPLKYLTISIPCDTAKQEVFFGQQSTLHNKVIRTIVAHSVTYLTKNPDGAAVVNATAFKNAFLSIRQDNADVVDNLPLAALQPQTNNGIEKDFLLENIDWPKSKVRVGSTTGLVANEEFVFTIGYHEKCNG